MTLPAVFNSFNSFISCISFISFRKLTKLQAHEAALEARSGFTTIELLIVLAIFVLSAATTVPFLGAFRETETVGTVAEDILQTLRRAQHRSMSGERERAWGVRFEADRFVLFGGDSFAARLPALDEVHRTREAAVLSGLREVVFLPLTGSPREAGFVAVSHPQGGSKRIEVNAVGAMYALR